MLAIASIPAAAMTALTSIHLMLCSPLGIALGIILVAANSFFVPFDSGAWPIWNSEQAIRDPVWLRQDRIGPVLPFEPMRRFGYPHEMRGKLRIKMRRHLDPCGTSDSRAAEPACHATDSHQVGHHVVAAAHGY